MIARNVCAAGRADLNECELPNIGRPAFKEPLDAAEPLDNSFGVVDAVHSDAHKTRFDPQIFQKCRTPDSQRNRLAPPRLAFAEIHANWERANQRRPAVPLHSKPLPLDARLQSTI